MMVQPPSFETLVLEVDRAAHVGVVRLNRPRKSNAIDASMWDEIPRAMRWMDEDEDVRVVVLCAAGKNFCAGIDVSTPESLSGQLGQSAAMKGDCPGRKAEALYRCALARAPSPTSRDPTSAPVPAQQRPVPARPHPSHAHTHVPLPRTLVLLMSHRHIRRLQESFTAIERCRKPVLCAVQGACFGGGVDMAVACASACVLRTPPSASRRSTSPSSPTWAPSSAYRRS